jgi:hypothetical protein
VNLDHIKRGYYSIKALNPGRIVPRGPALDWESPPPPIRGGPGKKSQVFPGDRWR